MHHAVRHVGLKLEGAAAAALSFSDLAKDYDHPVPADLYRVKRHERLADDGEAQAWVIRYAVSLLNGGLTVDGDMVSFAPGKGFDDLTWRRARWSAPALILPPAAESLRARSPASSPTTSATTSAT